MRDQFDRTIDYVRLSLTDRCQLKCIYCVPEEGLTCLSQSERLTRAELIEIVGAFAKIGVRKIKLTGGEPLLFPKLADLIAQMKQIEPIEKVTLTTNGLLLPKQLEKLVAAGLDGINISLDTMNEENYRMLTRNGTLAETLKGLDVALKAKIPLKINCVLLHTTTYADIEGLLDLAKEERVHVRFIEWMPIGSLNPLPAITETDILAQLKGKGYNVTPWDKPLGNGPARYYEVGGFKGKIGFISAVSQHFCDSCNRVRVTSDGKLKTCLAFNHGADLKDAMEKNRLLETIVDTLKKKPKRHLFNTGVDVRGKEEKNMIQIGG